MSANDSESVAVNSKSENSDSGKPGRTASNAVNTEELLASLSMLNLNSDEDSGESGTEKISKSSIVAAHLPLSKGVSEPMRVRSSFPLVSWIPF